MYSGGFLSPLLHPPFIIVSQEVTWRPNEWWGLGCQGFHSSSFLNCEMRALPSCLSHGSLVLCCRSIFLFYIQTNTHESTHDEFIVRFWAYLGAGVSSPLWAEKISGVSVQRQLFAIKTQTSFKGDVSKTGFIWIESWSTSVNVWIHFLCPTVLLEWILIIILSLKSICNKWVRTWER